MNKIVQAVLAAAILYLMSAGVVQAQCSGQFGAGTACGNSTGSTALPRVTPLSSFGVPTAVTIGGTKNALTFTVVGSPPPASLTSRSEFFGLATLTNDGVITAAVTGVSGGPYNVYKGGPAGPSRVIAGDIFATNLYSFTFDPALNSSAGGWWLTGQASAASKAANCAPYVPFNPPFQSGFTPAEGGASGNSGIAANSGGPQVMCMVGGAELKMDQFTVTSPDPTGTTAPSNWNISAVAAGASSKARLTLVNATAITTGTKVGVSNAYNSDGTASNINGFWTATNIDGTHIDLDGSTYDSTKTYSASVRTGFVSTGAADINPAYGCYRYISANYVTVRAPAFNDGDCLFVWGGPTLQSTAAQPYGATENFVVNPDATAQTAQGITIIGIEGGTPQPHPAVTITIASPAVATATAHGYVAGTAIQFATSGALPTGITAGTVYYVIAAGLGANTFEFSASAGGAAINTSGSQSGTQTVTAVVRTLYPSLGIMTGVTTFDSSRLCGGGIDSSVSIANLVSCDPGAGLFSANVGYLSYHTPIGQPIAGTVSGLKIANNSGAPTTKTDITFTAAAAQGPLVGAGGTNSVLRQTTTIYSESASVSQIIDTGTTGLNGMRAADSPLTVGTSYYILLLKNYLTGAVGVFLTTSLDTSTFPSAAGNGFTNGFYAVLGQIRTKPGSATFDTYLIDNAISQYNISAAETLAPIHCSTQGSRVQVLAGNAANYTITIGVVGNYLDDCEIDVINIDPSNTKTLSVSGPITATLAAGQRARIQRTGSVWNVNLSSPSSGCGFALTGDVTTTAGSCAATLATTQGAVHTWSAVNSFTAGVASTSKTTGSIVVTGGLGVSGAMFSDTLNVITMAQTAVAQSGTVCYNSGTGLLTYDASVGCLTSSLRYKKDWMPVPDAEALDIVVGLVGGSYTYKDGYGLPSGPQIGFAAENVGAVDDRLVARNPDGDVLGARYQQASALYPNAIRELMNNLSRLAADNDNLRAANDNLTRRMDAIERNTSNLKEAKP